MNQNSKGKIKYEEIQSVKSFLDFCCKRHGENYFFKKSVDDGFVDITYNQFRLDCCRLAAGLLKNGITYKHVGIISENAYEYFVCYFGTIMAGNAFVPVNQDIEEDKRNALLRFADVDAMFITERYDSYREGISENCPTIKTVISLNAPREGELSYEGLITSVTEEEALSTEFKDSIHDDKTAILLFTSGTSGGIPKAVELTAKNILASAMYGTNDLYDEFNKLYLVPLPLHHLAALNFIIYVLMPVGKEMALSVEVKEIFKDLLVYKPDYLMIVPALGEMLLKLLESEVDRLGKREEFEKYNKEADEAEISFYERREYGKQFKKNVGGNLVSLTFLGAKSSENMKKAFGHFGMKVRDGYGMTECSPMISAELAEYRLGSVGQVCPFNEVKIIDGVAWVKGDNVMKGYYKNPEGTKQIFNEDGFLCTGNLAELDDDGFLYILGRAKNDIALANGENIVPEEIEALLLKSEFISEALIVPDEKNKNTVVGALVYPNADVVKKDGRDAETIISEVVTTINKSLPIAQKIARFRIMDKPFEKNSMMKILRFKYPHIDA